MAARKSVLGVEIANTEIRVMRLQADGDTVRTATIGSTSLPEGAVVNGLIEKPEIVGSSLGTLLDSIGETTRRAVFALPPASVVARILEVPPVPDEELREIVQGEVLHYNILREGAGSFDFVRMHRPGVAVGAPTVLVMAADEPALHTIREVARRANVKVEGLEPLQIGMFRTAMAMAGAGATGCFVMVNETSTDIAIVDQGALVLYRTADHGAATLCRNDVTEPLNEEIATAIGTEISRSIDYYRREFPTASHVAKIYFATNAVGAHKFAGWIRETLDMDTVEVDPRVASDDPAAVSLKLPDGHKFVAVYGTAGRDLGAFDYAARFDLVDRDVESETQRAARRGLEVSLVASVLLLAAGLGIAWNLGGKANSVYHDLEHMKSRLSILQQKDRPEAESRMQAMQTLRTLASQGAPFPQIIDTVAESLDEGVGLSRVELDANWRVRVSGEAVNEAAMITTLDRLRRYPSFAGTVVDSFQAMTNTNRATAIQFEMSAQYLGRFPSQQGSQTTPVNPTAGGQ